eukprot:1180120-Prorocentrum_minimum.AAC.4
MPPPPSGGNSRNSQLEGCIYVAVANVAKKGHTVHTSRTVRNTRYEPSRILGLTLPKKQTVVT